MHSAPQGPSRGCASTTGQVCTGCCLFAHRQMLGGMPGLLLLVMVCVCPTHRRIQLIMMSASVATNPGMYCSQQRQQQEQQQERQRACQPVKTGMMLAGIALSAA